MTVTTISARLDASLRRHSAEPAIRIGADVRTYGELEQASASLRTQLERHGRAPVCLEGTASIETVVALIACVRTGTPVLVPSLGVPDSIRQRVLAAAGCRAVLTAEGAELGRLSEMPVSSAATGQVVPGPEEPEAAADDDCLLFATSGSTGMPKVVPIQGAAIDRFADWVDRQFGLGPGRRVLSYAPLHFDLSLFEVWSPLLTGAEVVIVESTVRTDADRLADLVRSSHVHIVEGVPMLHRLLVESGRRFESVEWVVTTGEAMVAPLAAQLPAAYPRARFANVYGSTETNDSHISELQAADLKAGRLPIGRPLPDVAMLIDGVEVREGRRVEGMLSVSTPFQANRVIGSRHEDQFLQHRGRTFYRTGDRVRHDADGTLHLLGRDDNLLKLRGTRVSIEAVEAAIGSHPLVVECGVCAPADDAGQPHLVAHVRISDEEGWSAIAMRKWCAEHLAPSSIPRRFQRWTTPLPRGVTGKLDRLALAAMPAEPPVRPTFAAADPRGRVTAHLIDEHLDCEPIGSIPGDLDLFATGILDSLSALVLVSWIETTFETAIADDDVAELVRTLDAIVEHIERGSASATMIVDADRPSSDLEEFLS